MNSCLFQLERNLKSDLNLLCQSLSIDAHTVTKKKIGEKDERAKEAITPTKFRHKYVFSTFYLTDDNTMRRMRWLTNA